jgi:hypothetical protein
MSWAQRLKRVFAIDIETRQQCGGRLRVIASIEEPVDPAHPSRAPPKGDCLV